MEIWKAAVLGIVQGLTEFLPVSSSGHILLFERLLGVSTGGADMFLGIVLHAGTLVAVIAVYFKKLLALFRPPFSDFLRLLIATVPAALVGVLLGDLVDKAFFGGKFLWVAFALTAVLLALAERKTRRTALYRPVDKRRALVVGLAQAVAVIPGLSRSGTTLSAAVLCGASRDEAADFSFLMSVPIIAGALLVEIVKCAKGGVSLAGIGFPALAVGTLLSFLCGLFAIGIMLKAIKKGKYGAFCIYLIVLSILLIIFPF